MYILIFGWLRVADILSNPFGNDEHFDINLSSTLDLNIWKASVCLESQDQVLHTDLLEQPQTETKDDYQQSWIDLNSSY